MYRKRLIELLSERPQSVRSIAEHMQVPIQEVLCDIEHLSKTLKRTELRLLVEPAQCRKCGFTFRPHKLAKPGKCPRCRSNWIQDPVLRVAPVDSN